MKNNVIPRKAKKLSVTFKQDVSKHKAGDTVTIEKNFRGDWSDGESIYFASMLRDADICGLQVIA